jgi:hypothetical protein
MLEWQTLGWFPYATPFQTVPALSDTKTPGPVVRISPNELSFASVESWKAIYGHQPAGTPTPIKSEFYSIYGAGFRSLCIGSERDPKKHAQMRKMLSAAFATKALVEQEAIFTNVVDKFIGRIGVDGGPQCTGGINMTKWYEMVSFDILGEMAFGESFGCIETGERPEVRTSPAARARLTPTQESLISGRNSL